MAGKLTDSRQLEEGQHTLERSLPQLMFVVAMNYEDVNDHGDPRDELRCRWRTDRTLDRQVRRQ